ncbi:MAG: PQQ-binding-like beta-propeller repeat protein [Acidobacteriota bacterium]|nr:PQQ-binding-like beta-propeller repeat protein [Acidobacteriota bacterium]
MGQKCSRRKKFHRPRIKFFFAALSFTLLNLWFPLPARASSNGDIRLNQPLKSCWTFPAAGTPTANIASDNALIYVPSLDGEKLTTISTDSGLVEWEIELGGQLRITPYLNGDLLLIILKSESGYVVRRLEKKTGVTVWQTLLAANQTTANQSAPAAKFYPYAFGDQILVVDGKGVWRTYGTANGEPHTVGNLSAALTAAPYFEGEQAVFATADKSVTLFSLETVSEMTSFKVSTIPLTVSKIGRRLFWTDAGGNLNSFEYRGAARLKKWKLRVGGQISDLASAKENLIFSSLDNYLYSAAAANGEIIWKSRLAGRSAFTPLTAGDYVAASSIGEDSATVFETQTGKTVNRINLGAKNFSTGAPRISGHFVVFPTAQGLFAFTSDKFCADRIPTVFEK